MNSSELLDSIRQSGRTSVTYDPHSGHERGWRVIMVNPEYSDIESIRELTPTYNDCTGEKLAEDNLNDIMYSSEGDLIGLCHADLKARVDHSNGKCMIAYTVYRAYRYTDGHWVELDEIPGILSSFHYV